MINTTVETWPMVGDVWADKAAKEQYIEITDITDGRVYYTWLNSGMAASRPCASFCATFIRSEVGRMWRMAKLTTFGVRFVIGAAVVIAVVYALWRW